MDVRTVYMAENTANIASTNKAIASNSFQTVAFLRDAVAGISDLKFLNALQYDLQKEAVYIHWQNNALLQNIATQVADFKNLVLTQANQQQQENYARELIYTIKKFDAALAKNKDAVYISSEAKLLLAIINQNDISTASFQQIQDKEYFDNLIEDLAQKRDAVSAEEKEEADVFLAAYFCATQLAQELQQVEPIKLQNCPAEVTLPQMPDRPEILEIENELQAEIESPYKEFSFYNHKKLTTYIPSSNELGNLFERFYAEKKQYEQALLRYNMAGKLKAYIDDTLAKEKQYEEIAKKFQVLNSAANRYLAQHPEFKESYPPIAFSEAAPKEIDFFQIEKENNEALSQKESALKTSLQNYYDTYSAKLQIKKEKCAEVPQKKSWLARLKETLHG